MASISWWLFRFGRLILGVAVVTSGVVFVPQLFDHYACVTFTDYRTNELLIYDTSHGRIVTDTRYRYPRYWLTPIDYYLASMPVAENPSYFSLILEPIEDGMPIVLETSVRLPETNWLSIQSAWTADGRQVAYLTQDDARNNRLTIFSLDDLSRRSAYFALPGGNTGTTWLGEWSPDNAYIAVRRFDSVRPYVTVAVWSTEAMELFPLPATASLISFSAWSPVGHQLAALKYSRQEGNELLLIDPENINNPTRIPITTEGEIQGIDWSPTGDFLVIARLATRADEGSPAQRQWYFDFYGQDGRVLQENVASKIRLNPQSQAPGTVTFIQPNVIPGFWSQDGDSWVMLQDVIDREQPETRLSVFDPTTNTYHVVENHVLGELYVPMFQRSEQLVTFAEEGVFPENDYLLLPYRRNDVVMIDYLDLRNNTRLTLLEGADAVLSDAYNFNVPQRFLWGEKRFLIPWRTRGNNGTEERLTLLSSEGGSRIAEVTDMEAIEQIGYLTEDWVGFVATREGRRGIELLNLTTGEHRQVPGEVPEEQAWYGILSPGLEQIALVFSSGRSFTSTDRGGLRFASLENDTSREIHEEISPFGMWSPLGDSFAFFWGMPTRMVLQVVNARGETVAEIDLPRRLGTDSLSLRGWSRCEANPEFSSM